MSSIRHQQAAGLSPHDIARYFNARGNRVLNGKPWDSELVLSVTRLDAAIRRHDAIMRADRLFKASL
jgi:hypothetical protein